MLGTLMAPMAGSGFWHITLPLIKPIAIVVTVSLRL